VVVAAAAAGVDARYRELRSTKGHDAFLVEWDQLAAIVEEALEDGVARGIRAATVASERVAGAA
jgi:hypothetical protein